MRIFQVGKHDKQKCEYGVQVVFKVKVIRVWMSCRVREMARVGWGNTTEDLECQAEGSGPYAVAGWQWISHWILAAMFGYLDILKPRQAGDGRVVRRLLQGVGRSWHSHGMKRKQWVWVACWRKNQQAFDSLKLREREESNMLLTLANYSASIKYDNSYVVQVCYVN